VERVSRKLTVPVRIGGVTIGGTAPIAVQSMTCTKTEDVDETMEQVRRLIDAGCEIVRVAVPGAKALAALRAIVERSPVPIVADIHFRLDLALGSIEAGAAKVRINPGNLGPDAFLTVLDAAGAAGVPLRIGVNSGSVPMDLIEAHGGPTPDAMVEAAARYVAIAEARGFRAIVLSLKSSDTLSTLRAYRRASERFTYPLHLGVTEAGDAEYGQVKSAAALGGLLLDGIGDTIRISLVGDPVREVGAAYALLKATGRRILTPEIIACPTCGRRGIDVERLVEQVKARLGNLKAPLKIAICGCVVNGPGEAREADLGIAGGGGYGVVFRHGETLKRVPEEQLVDTLVEEALKMAEGGDRPPETAKASP
jgi:(E)-4-hydroxy-3-methylbut-2-enyl-diphosphate synthase